MRLDLSEIITSPGMTTNVELNEQLDAEGIELAEPVTGRLRFQNSGDLLLIDGDIQTKLRLDCSRCLGDVYFPVAERLEERFPLEDIRHPQAPPDEGEEYDSTISSVVSIENGKAILDLGELIRQYLVMDTPIKPLCAEECRGLCPTCGHNLNEGSCQCPPEEEEGPLAEGLRAALSSHNGNGGG
jgi:uncharacterized protein